MRKGKSLKTTLGHRLRPRTQVEGVAATAMTTATAPPRRSTRKRKSVSYASAVAISGLCSPHPFELPAEGCNSEPVVNAATTADGARSTTAAMNPCRMDTTVIAELKSEDYPSRTRTPASTTNRDHDDGGTSVAGATMPGVDVVQHTPGRSMSAADRPSKYTRLGAFMGKLATPRRGRRGPRFPARGAVQCDAPISNVVPVDKAARAKKQSKPTQTNLNRTVTKAAEALAKAGGIVRGKSAAAKDGSGSNCERGQRRSQRVADAVESRKLRHDFYDYISRSSNDAGVPMNAEKLSERVIRLQLMRINWYD